MFRILIAYASKTGTTENCVRILEKELKGLDITIADLESETPDVSAYDIVIVGSSVRFARIRPAVAEFFKMYEQELSRKPHALFLCCGFGHEFEEYSEKLFPENIRNSAFIISNFGGTLKLPDAGVAERIILYFVRSSIRESELEDGEYTPTLPGILPENISVMASAVRRELIRLR